MHKKLRWQIKFGSLLIILSLAFYGLHYYLFHDLHHIFLYLVGDIAFLFLDVLIVTLVLHQLLEYREQQGVMKKLNMVIGTFFSEAGTDLLRYLVKFDTQLTAMSCKLVVMPSWQNKDFSAARRFIQAQAPVVDSRRADLKDLGVFLKTKRQFLLSLLENPNLLEHEAFTETLWAVFHLTDELMHRVDFSSLPEDDYQHLSGDIKRAYEQLTLRWLDYMEYLKHDYPYLFSLAVRTNPFDAQACVEVKS